MPKNPIRELLRRQQAERQQFTAEEHIPEEPDDDQGPAWDRSLKECAPLAAAVTSLVEIEEARRVLPSALREYFAQPYPTYVLVAKANPGTGKTTAAITVCEEMAAKGRRVLYLGPRHEFITDIRELSQNPGWWYEWLPRQEVIDGDPEDKIETCRYARYANTYMTKGYDGIKFCQQVCGWDYINHHCLYYGQKRREEPIIFGQHQHLWGGHPLEFSIVIGDESPLAAMCHPWVIPARYIVPSLMPDDELLTRVLMELQGLAVQEMKIEGPALLAALGGAERVRAAIESLRLPADAVAAAPTVEYPSDAEKVDYWHLSALSDLLRREAIAAENGEDYPHRVIVERKGLVLLLRHRVSDKLPPHLAWLDATAHAHLYQTVFQRPVEVIEPQVRSRGRIFQVYDRANGKATLIKDGEPTDKVKQTVKQIQQITKRHSYKRVGIITHLAVEEQFKEIAQDMGHFFAERGTNRFDQVEALIVIGVPQPPLNELDKLARMLYWERMTPFTVGNKLPWSVRREPFRYVAPDGRGRTYPASGFWGDEDLQALLWQFREGELVQAAHRSRLNLREVDVWLLENLPVKELAPTELLSIRDVFQAPSGVNVYEWPEVLALAESRLQTGDPLYSTDIVEAIKVDPHTARSYLAAIQKIQPELWTVDGLMPKTGRGRPAKGLMPAGRNKGNDV